MAERPAAQQLACYAPAAIVLLAEVHGSSGHVPSVLGLKSTIELVAGYEFAEIISMRCIGERACGHR